MASLDLEFEFPPFVCVAAPNDAKPFDQKKEPINQATESMWYPGCQIGFWSRLCYMYHQRSVWIVDEVTFDSDSNYLPPQDLCEVTAKVIAALHRGDTVVAKFLDRHLSWFENNASANTFFSDQNSRENVHNITYSKMLDVLNVSANKYRSEMWYNEVMAPFTSLMNKYVLTPTVSVYFIMMCEKIMFAPLFFWINSLHTYKFCPKIALTNIMVMRDEHTHYQHARMLLATGVARPPTMDQCNQMLNDFKTATLQMIKLIITSKEYKQYKLLSLDSCIIHLNHIITQFKIENGLFHNYEEIPNNDVPTDYMMQVLNSSTISYMKTNPMESIGINYIPPSTSRMEYNFDDSSSEDEGDAKNEDAGVEDSSSESEDENEHPSKKQKLSEEDSSSVPIAEIPDVFNTTPHEKIQDLPHPYADDIYSNYGAVTPRKNWLAYAYCPKEFIETTKQMFPRQTDSSVNPFEPYADYDNLTKNSM